MSPPPDEGDEDQAAAQVGPEVRVLEAFIAGE